MSVSQLKRIAGVRDPVAGGFYTVREAARLLNIPHVRRIVGWLRGYPSRAAGPIINRQYEPIKGIHELGFWDLLEVRFVEHFRRQGVSAQALRVAAKTAREVLNQSHPFATSNVKFITDRREVFLRTANDVGDAHLLNLVTKQYGMYVVLEEVLARGIAFDPLSGLAETWKPEPAKYPNVILDPLRAYGHPVLAEPGVPTAAVFNTWKAENANFSAAAEWYEIDEALAREAVLFELELPN
jgi:hypothetical protein